jgi:hypothetical protein
MADKDRPVKFTVTVEVTINSSDGTRQDALDHLGQMIAWYGLEGIQMAALEPVHARIARSDGTEFELAYEHRPYLTGQGGGSGRQL